ncbi:hypothetical protein LSAT2_002576 [Lamellibrachia satsuma]|nr:hypothetical protein LSAT2_002576 [Lamellibrachia satsuma]
MLVYATMPSIGLVYATMSSLVLVYATMSSLMILDTRQIQAFDTPVDFSAIAVQRYLGVTLIRSAVMMSSVSNYSRANVNGESLDDVIISDARNVKSVRTKRGGEQKPEGSQPEDTLLRVTNIALLLLCSQKVMVLLRWSTVTGVETTHTTIHITDRFCNEGSLRQIFLHWNPVFGV